jgi:uncharacterized membrane protein
MAVVTATRAQGTVGIFSERIAGALAYLSFVPAIIFLFVEPYKSNRFVRFHSWQCLMFCGATVVGAAILRLATLVFSIIPVVGPLILVVVVVSAILAVVFLWLVSVVKALQGEMFEIPLIGGFARQYAGTL